MYESIITEQKQYFNNHNNLSTLLQIKGTGDLWELFEYKLPYPHEYKRFERDKYEISWYIEGVFLTKKGTEFINDILARFLLSFENITYSTTKTIKNDKSTLKAHLFKQLNSIKKQNFTADSNKYEDSVFWSLKLFVEHYIGEGDFCPYSVLENYAFNHFIDHVKDRSTLKAKCRSIWNYYDNKNWKSDRENIKYERKLSKEEYLMTRRENIKKQRDKRAESTRRAVIQAITGMFANEYKKKSGEWNISKISKEIHVSRNSVYKYINEYENQE